MANGAIELDASAKTDEVVEVEKPEYHYKT